MLQGITVIAKYNVSVQQRIFEFNFLVCKFGLCLYCLSMVLFMQNILASPEALMFCVLLSLIPS